MVIEAQFPQYAHAETRVVVIYVGVPLLPCSGGDVAVVLHFHVLEMQSDEEAVVQLPHIQIGAVHHLALLRSRTDGAREAEQQAQSMCKQGFHL